MNNTFIYICLLLISSNAAIAQLDSLINQLEVAVEWKDKINAHQDLAYYYVRSDSSKVMTHIDAMLDISQKQNDKFGFYQSYTSLASFYTYTSRYGLAEEAMDKVYQLSLELNEPEKTSAVLGNIGVLKYYQNEIDSAKYYLDTAYQIKRTLPGVDSSNLSRNLTSLAAVSQELNLIEEAIKYQLAALRISEAIGDNSSYLNALTGLASLYNDLDEPEKAFQYQTKVYNTALEIDDLEALGVSARNLGMKYMEREQLDSALYFFKVSLTSFEKMGYKRGLAEVNISLGDWYVESEEYDKSIPYYEQAISYTNEIDDDRLSANAQKNLGLVYLEKGSLSKAENLIQNGLQLYKGLNHIDGIQESYLALSNYYGQTNNWKLAHDNKNRYHAIADSLQSIKLNEEVKTLQIQYETELKDAEINKQNLIIKNQKSERRFIISLSLALLALGSIAAMALSYRNRKNKLLTEQDLKLKSSKIEQLKKERKLMAMSSMIEGQESERARIAKDLHDGLGGLLSSVRSRLSNIDQQVQQIESYNVYERTTEIVDEACDEVRRISHNLLPGALRLDGLGTAISLLGEELSEVHNIDVNTEVFGFEHMKDDTESIFIYRIIQEATNNIIKYAKATEIFIQLHESEEQLQVVIEDNGVGFDTSKAYEGLGLRSIVSRVEFLKGELDIDSTMNQGTTITFSIPKEHN